MQCWLEKLWSQMLAYRIIELKDICQISSTFENLRTKDWNQCHLWLSDHSIFLLGSQEARVTINLTVKSKRVCQLKVLRSEVVDLELGIFIILMESLGQRVVGE